MVAALPQARDDLAEYKRMAEASGKAVAQGGLPGFQQPLGGIGGVYVGNASGTVTSYAANSLVTR